MKFHEVAGPRVGDELGQGVGFNAHGFAAEGARLPIKGEEHETRDVFFSFTKRRHKECGL